MCKTNLWVQGPGVYSFKEAFDIISLIPNVQALRGNNQNSKLCKDIVEKTFSIPKQGHENGIENNSIVYDFMQAPRYFNMCYNMLSCRKVNNPAKAYGNQPTNKTKHLQRTSTLTVYSGGSRKFAKKLKHNNNKTTVGTHHNFHKNTTL